MSPTWTPRSGLSWRLSNTLDTEFCLDALRGAAKAAGGWPEILNTDQGCQFTSRAWIGLAEANGVRVSMDGRRRWIDVVMVERFWRSVKYEDVYLREYQDLVELEGGVARWIDFYNHARPHLRLDQLPGAGHRRRRRKGGASGFQVEGCP